jgi:predicted acylesterase/phospholipase RssA
MTRNTIILPILTLVIALLSGCSPARRAVPENMIETTAIPDMPANIRVFDQDFVPDFKQDANDANGCALLALSGGGANGAFGAGVLYGWTQSGKRPQFQVVTGISTGALIAPLAFLGSDCDKELKQIYTSISDKDIFIVKDILGFAGMLWNESYADTKPLSQLIERTLTQERLDAIAREHAKGRRLYVGTTYLDAQRFVIWDMGAIASSRSPKAAELFRKVLLASSAFPGAFPPVFFDVQAADGNMYDEMHVDGGVVTGVFCYVKPLSETGQTPTRLCDIYVIKNGIGAPDVKQVKRNAIKILEHSFFTMMKIQTWTDLNRIYWMAKHDNAEFAYMCIPKEYVPKTKKMFDPKEMKILFDIGYEKGKNCDWKNQLVIE